MDFDEVPDPEDRYQFGDVLGRGVYGKVYLATDNQASQKAVAIKLQKYEDETKEFIEEEYKILRDLSNHANLVDFYGIYRNKYEIWFVMELCQGGPVLDLVNGLLAKNRRMVEEHIAYILKETVKALIYLHENNVIHRDIKGSNILLTKEGEVKLCDFGLSQMTKSSEERLSTRLGSPCWMAPELVAANPVKDNADYDNRVDVWAIGITAIELGEGKAPFHDMHPSRTLFQIITNPPPALHKLSYWSEDYHDFINECLVKNFDHRPYIVEIIEHPFLEQVPENNYHLSLEIKSLLADITADASLRSTEINVNGRFFKKGVDGNVEPMYEEDLATLQSITEDHVLMLLETRLGMGEAYSFIGDILLYLNPNEKKNVYGSEFHRKYQFKSRSENAPHIYAVGDTAYQNALHHVTPQQIILSGETGSGKTTNYLHLLDHLFFLGESPSINSGRITNAVNLIHALIHASTPSNDYSTRAVFKTHISYGRTGKLSGASFKTHCLEKWRVSSTDMSQSNYHILYYIYDGLVASQSAETYKLNSDREYRYLRIQEETKSNQPNNDIKNNVIKYKKIVRYLEELEFSNEQINTIYSTIAAILNLGEAQFEEKDDDCSAELENREVIQNFSDLLGIENKKISWALTNHCLVRGGNAIRKRNTCEEASDTRDVLANNLYSRLVDYIISIINNKLSFGKAIFGEKYSVKILDYFGFECFKQNNISQFLVNCLNEQLHYHFLQRIFSWEAMDLQNEEVKYTPISYYSNKVTLNELLGKPDGVLSIIDDASKKGHNGRYVIDNIDEQRKTKVNVTDSLEFSVSHYTGTVLYNVREFPEKNRDFLPPEVIETLRGSQNPIVSMLFTNKLDKNGNLCFPDEEIKVNKYSYTSRPSSNQFSQIKKMRTQGTIFRALCLDLLKELSVGSGSGGTHFVRCIRTDLRRREYFHKELVRQQLRALAILETAKARKRGYPHRISFPEFLKRYKFLAFDFEENVEVNKDNCRLLMVRLKVEGWALGRTKIFLKYYNEEYLSRLYETQVKKIIKIQTILRGFLAKCKVAKEVKNQEIECIEEIQRQRRGSEMTEDEAAHIIQKAYRKTNKRKDHSDMLEPLEEMDRRFIKPFATKWKNPSIFNVLMRYRAIKLQDFFNFSQQVHLYNLGPFDATHQNLNSIDLNSIDEKATVSSWLGEQGNTVLKLRFRLDEIPFYDTSYMQDLHTNLGSFGKEDAWDTPFRWREDLSSEKLKCNELKVNLEGPRGLVNIQYTRDPDNPIEYLPSPAEEIEDSIDGISEIDEVENDRIKCKINIKNQGTSSNENVNKQYNKHRGDLTPNRNQTQHIDVRNKNKAEKESFNIYTKPANKDFDYIKATPITSKPKHYVDPILELRTIARTGTNISEDDPPFNFQGMLRKTNFRRDSMNNVAESVRRDSLKNAADGNRRDSLKNAVQAMRRFSLTKDNENTTNRNTNDNRAGKGIPSKQISVEILPGIFMNGLEAEL